jgi:hypothetical protein
MIAMSRSYLFIFVFALIACNSEGPGTSTAPTTDTKAASGALDPWKERDQWQHPEGMIGMMGGDLRNRVVADLFADDGYFTFKLLDAGADVIAVVNEPAQAERLEELKKAKGITDDRLRIRLVPVGDPGLMPEEADMALMVHRFTTISDKNSYFNLMRRGLRYPYLLFMLEWPKKQTQHGPPLALRAAPEEIMETIGSLNYTDVSFNAATIPDQVIYVAHDPMDDMGAPESTGLQ